MGRILGIDFGLRRIGAALSDPRASIATPLETYERRDARQDAAHYRELFREEDVDRVVIGLPLHTGGGESELSKQARAWGAWLSEICGRPVVFFDERYTSVHAEDLMRSAGLKARDRRARRDMLAAQILLQAYLDAGAPEVERPPAPIEDGPEEGAR